MPKIVNQIRVIVRAATFFCVQTTQHIATNSPLKNLYLLPIFGFEIGISFCHMWENYCLAERFS